ncbi:uncharacterized protein LOC128715246 [Anopheles marshallii]|uniref:uncharacterized protein LOC128715246 n=1 Tax=Anopheles marshallii TaxID=1521116 RepID=UPI00237AFAE9|nr:uncharacterized protein LOC128715246 [Anopheles marshallii]
MKTVLLTMVVLGCCATLNSAGMYHYHKQPGPPPSQPQYLPNYDVPPPQEYGAVKHHSWENMPWTPITNFPWPGPEYVHEVHYAPHYHGGATTPCPNKKHYVTKVTTTTTHKPTTTTTTTHRPVETKKPHLLEKLGNTHKH